MAEKRRDKKGRILRKGESQRTDGRYMYRYMDCSGEYRTVYSWRLVETDPHPKGKRQEDALRTKEEQIEENNRDMNSNISSSMTLNELFDHYVKMQIKRKKIKKRTSENYVGIWNKSLYNLPMASMPIGKIRKTHILDTYQQMQANGVGNGSIILLHKRFIKIDHQLIYELDENDERRFQVTGPKTIKSIRKVPLSMRALQALKMQRKQMQEAGLLKNHTVDGHNGFVFLREDGQLLNAGRLDLLIHRIVYECNARKIANAIKTDTEPELLPNISTHILRHTACTRMAEKGMDQRTLQEIMGHQNLALTMKVYNHVDEKRMRDEMDKLDAVRDVSKAVDNDNNGKVFKVS